MILVRHLFISAGHNFCGQHGQPPGSHPILEVEEVHCLAGRGLRGDRYLDRFLHHAITIPITGRRYRVKDSLPAAPETRKARKANEPLTAEPAS